MLKIIKYTLATNDFSVISYSEAFEWMTYLLNTRSVCHTQGLIPIPKNCLKHYRFCTPFRDMQCYCESCSLKMIDCCEEIIKSLTDKYPTICSDIERNKKFGI